MIVPALILAGIIGGIAWLVRPKGTGVVGEAIGMCASIGEENAKPIPGGYRYRDPAALPEMDLAPEQQRLLSLLVLFARDKQYPAGKKRYLTAPMAYEASQLAKKMGLPRTSMAIRKDAPVPDDEFFPERADSIRVLTVKYGTTGKA